MRNEASISRWFLSQEDDDEQEFLEIDERYLSANFNINMKLREFVEIYDLIEDSHKIQKLEELQAWINYEKSKLTK